MSDENSTVKKSISLPQSLLDAAVRRSADEHRSLSSYIQLLIIRDTASPRENEITGTPA
jgi:hypothetical protein